MENRIIKFRAWSKNAVGMQYRTLAEYQEKGFGLPYPHDPDVVVMQFTGLKDKNGKEIYEGDIVKWIEFASIEEENEGIIHDKGIGIIEWGRQANEAEWLIVRDTDIHSLSSFPNRTMLERSDVEVIGNIYENPELLN